jgi:diguanylate cyclase (GGDEF)-like protein
MPQGICLYDAQDRLQLVNEQFCKIYNQPMSRLRIEMSLYEVLCDSCAIGNYPGRKVDDIYAVRKAFINKREKGTFLQELGDGRLIAIHHQPLEDGGWVCTYEDVTERRRAEAQVEFLAHHDGLTRLPNRRLFNARLGGALKGANDGVPCALLCLDLDGFKGVNDQLGHAAGDALLQEVAERLKQCMRKDDTAARLGGDEFAIVLPNASAAEAVEIAQRVTASLSGNYSLGVFGEAQVGVSIGIACAPEHALACPGFTAPSLNAPPPLRRRGRRTAARDAAHRLRPTIFARQPYWLTISAPHCMTVTFIFATSRSMTR